MTSWTPYDPCPCGCGERSAKLTKCGHVRGCRCRSCTGRRNRARGRRAERSRHLALGGVGATPQDETAVSYTLTVTTQDKAGEQVPMAFRRFVALEWTRRALEQAERSVAVGSGAKPALYLEPPGGGRWLVVRL